MKRVLILLTFLTATSAFAATPGGFALGDQPANPAYIATPAFAFNSTVPGFSSFTSLPFSPISSPFTLKSIRWLLPSVT